MSKVLENCEPMLSNKIVNGEKFLTLPVPIPNEEKKLS